MSETDLKALLGALSPEARKLVSALRSVDRRTVPQAEDTVLWGSLWYHRTPAARPEIAALIRKAASFDPAK